MLSFLQCILYQIINLAILLRHLCFLGGGGLGVGVHVLIFYNHTRSW